MDFPNPHSLLEAYYSMYEQPEEQVEYISESYIQEDYLDEEDEYFYEVAQFLLDEGYTEEDIFELAEEEDFLNILDYIEEKMTAADYRSLSRHGKKRLRQAGMKLQDPHEYKGAAAKKSREGVQSRRAERQAWDDATPRQKEIAKRGRESSQRVTLARLDKEAEKIHQDNKKQAAAQKPSQTAVGRLKSAFQAGVERHKAATNVAGKVAKGVGAYIGTKNAAKVARAGGKKASDAAIERLARKKAHKAAAEEFEYVLDYVMEEGYEYEEALDIIEQLDDETIEDIMEVKGMGGHVDPDSGEYSGKTSRAQRHRYKAGGEGVRSRTNSSGHVAGGRAAGHTSSATVSGAGKGSGSSKHPEMKKSPLEKAKAKHDALRQSGQNKRANKISKFLERGGNRYD